MLLEESGGHRHRRSEGDGPGHRERFAKEGAKVTIADIDMAGRGDAVRAIEAAGGQGLAVKCDVTKSDQVKAMVAATVATFGKLDILVNNAGAVIGTHGKPTNLEVLTEEAWDTVVDLNLKGIFLCSREAVPHMKANGYGKIVNFSSLGAISPPRRIPHYHAAKSGVLGLTYDMAAELGPHNIYVNAIMPGPVPHAVLRRDRGVEEPEGDRGLLRRIGKHGAPGPHGRARGHRRAVLFLASDMSSYVTGAVAARLRAACRFRPEHSGAGCR